MSTESTETEKTEKSRRKKSEAAETAAVDETPGVPIMGHEVDVGATVPETPRIALGKLVFPTMDSRANLDEEPDDEFVASIKANNILQPLGVARIKDSDKVLIVYGRRRARAARMLKFKDVPVYYLPLEPMSQEELENTLVSAGLTENVDRKGLTPWDKAVTFKRLLDAGWDQVRIAKVARITQGSVSQCLDIFELDPRVQTIVKRNINSEGMFSKVRELIRFKDPEMQLSVAKDAFDPAKGWTAKDVKTVLEKVKAKEAEKAEREAQKEKEKGKKKRAKAKEGGDEGAEEGKTEAETVVPSEFANAKFTIGVKQLRSLLDATTAKIQQLKSRSNVKPETIEYQKGFLDGLKTSTGMKELPAYAVSDDDK